MPPSLEARLLLPTPLTRASIKIQDTEREAELFHDSKASLRNLNITHCKTVMLLPSLNQISPTENKPKPTLKKNKKSYCFLFPWINKLKQFTERPDKHPSQRMGEVGQHRQEKSMLAPSSSKSPQTSPAACETTVQDLSSQFWFLSSTSPIQHDCLKPLVKVLLTASLSGQPKQKDFLHALETKLFSKSRKMVFGYTHKTCLSASSFLWTVKNSSI